ncbi:MAG: hypothetical protein V4813_09915 [Gemmatimonadota bacterium]
MQPWSDAARGVVRAERARKAGRRRQLERFNEGLVSIVLRDIEEEHTLAWLLGPLVKMAWAPLMFAGAAVLHRYTGGSGFTRTELATGLSLSILVGLYAGRLHEVLRGDVHVSVSEPDPFGAAQDEVGFTTLGLRDSSLRDAEPRPTKGFTLRDDGDTRDG